MVGQVTTACGWCITNDHKDCKPFIEYEGKRWDCECLQRGHKPKEK